jgi:predicted phosphodiesterase
MIIHKLIVFKSIKADFKVPCHLASGNHDVGNIPNDSTLNYYRKIIGKDYFEFKNKGYSFIITNTQLWKIDVEKESQKHDDWFKETLKNQKNNPVIVIGHFPLFIELPKEEDHYFNLPITKRQELLNLFLKNNVKAYLSGHTHKTVINNYKNIQLVSGETTSKNFDDRHLGFRLWNITPDTLKHRFIALDSLSVP